MFWMLGVALAGPLPEGIDLEDVTAWEERAFAMPDGPPGCWVFHGEFQARAAIYHPATFFSRGETDIRAATGTFVGTLTDGEWTRFVYTITDPGESEEDGLQISTNDDALTLFPLVGRLDPAIIERDPSQPPPVQTEEEEGRQVSISFGSDGEASSEEAVNLLRGSVEEWWDASVTTSYMRWDEALDGAWLVVEVPTSDERGAELVTMNAFFPGAGEHATRIDSILPRRLSVGDGFIKAKVMNGQLHLEGRVVDGRLMPVTESWGAVLGALGFTVGYEQRIAYTSAQECP
ncbi:MAG: hypothetical protein ACI8S6_002157 [Myxococcota bacterium]|jgi:hypothetical protein